jgi:hypothetical protein
MEERGGEKVRGKGDGGGKKRGEDCALSVRFTESK